MAASDGWHRVPLYGGAMSMEIPDKWVDVSRRQEVPDHQEVWMHVDTAAVTVLEINERALVDGGDDAALEYCFTDLAEYNDADEHALFHGAARLNVEDVPALASHASRFGAACAYIGTGVQGIVKGRGSREGVGDVRQNVRIALGLLRLPDVTTDVLLTISTPPQEAAPGATGAEDAEVDTADLRRALRTLQIHDPTLFG